MSISEPEWHYQILDVSQQGVEGSFPFVALPDPDKVVGVPEIQFGEIGGSMEEFEIRVG